jgi:hypothetical protein
MQKHILIGIYDVSKIDDGCMDLPHPIFLKKTIRPESLLFSAALQLPEFIQNRPVKKNGKKRDEQDDLKGRLYHI